MKTVGICIPTIEGGVVCHQEIGREAARRGVEIPEIVTHTPLYSVIGHALATRDFSALAGTLAESVARIAAAGAHFVLIPSNTMHFVFPEIAASSPVPLLNILETTAAYCREKGYARVGVLGTAPTIQRRLYDPALAAEGIEPSYPTDEVAEELDLLIRDELLKGLFRPPARDRVRSLIDAWQPPVDAVILGCTELPLLLGADDCTVPLVDSTRILAHAALDTAHSEQFAVGARRVR